MNSKHEKFGKYILLERLAAGGMAEVHLAKTPGVGGVSKFFAVKRILPQYSETPEFIDMFKDEAKITVNLKHSNIVSIYEFGMERKQFYLTMDFIEGKNLRQILNKIKKEKRQFSIEQILYIVNEAASGLDSAHRCLDDSTGKPLNIIHRDMSPQNIMISYEGEVKIIDFGIAKAESQMESTRAGTLKGKFGYMSPEQAEGLAIDLRTDIFSLGIILWELLANERLFIANNEINTLRKIRDCQIPNLRKINPNVSQELEAIVMKALTQDRNARYQTTAAFHKDLNRHLNRQYPDFSSHDFSMFIKTLFADEILQNRKKFVDYIKTPFEQASSTIPSENTEITQTITSIKPSQLGKSNSKPNKSSVDFNKIKLNRADVIKQGLDNKKRNENSFSRNLDITPVSSSSNNHSTVTSLTSSVSNYTSTSTISQHSYRRQASGNKTFKFISLLLILLGTIYLVKPQLVKDYIAKFTHVTQSKTAASNVKITPEEAALLRKKKTHSFMVLSEPSGARIYLNNKFINSETPGIIPVPKNKRFTVSLHKPGYKVFTQSYKVNNEGQQMKIPLEQAVIGFVNINVIPNYANIYVNGEKLTKKSPIKNYQIPAGKKVVIRAINPFTQQSKEKLTIVDRNQIKNINFDLSRSVRKRLPSNRNSNRKRK